MLGTESGFLHNAGIAAIAGAAGLRLEHVVVVAFVIAVLEAFRAETHALTDAASSAPVGHKVGRPNEAAHGRVIELTHVGRKVFITAAAADKPTTPVDRVLVVDGLFRVQQMVQQGGQVSGWGFGVGVRG